MPVKNQSGKILKQRINLCQLKPFLKRKNVNIDSQDHDLEENAPENSEDNESHDNYDTDQELEESKPGHTNIRESSQIEENPEGRITNESSPSQEEGGFFKDCFFGDESSLSSIPQCGTLQFQSSTAKGNV